MMTGARCSFRPPRGMGRLGEVRSSGGSGFMDFTADHYYRAALERMSQAHSLYLEGVGKYALAMYTAGVAVESMLRAFMLKRGKSEFESHHDILLLAKVSGMLNVNRDK